MEERLLNEHDGRMLDLSRLSLTLSAALSRWWTESTCLSGRGIPLPRTSRLLYQLFIAALVLFGLQYLTFGREAVSPNIDRPTPPVRHIPPKIWQIYLDFHPVMIAPHREHISSWISGNPSYGYTILDKAGAVSMMSNLLADPLHARMLPVFYAMSRRVMRADFLRYVLLATQGGIYSDVDTQLFKPVDSWIPEEYKAATRLIVGLEADQSPPVAGTTYEVQFCQWTLAAAPHHPAMLEMVNNILEQVQNRPYQKPPAEVEYSDDEVLDITGPAAWTRVVYKFLSKAAGSPIGWRNLTGLKEPRLFGDILVLPIDAFATGVGHSGAVPGGSPDALILHGFSGSWKNGFD